MKINVRLTEVSLKINKLFLDNALSKADCIDVLLQFAIKIYFIDYKDKDKFITYISDTYDAIEKIKNLTSE